MERVYPKPTTQAMMIRLIQDYYDCPVFYLPWTRDALTVHLHPPLDYTQLEEAENAEGVEKQERDRQNGGRREKMNVMIAEATLDFDMGTDLVTPDVFTKQMYMRSFIRYELEADKASAAAIQRRVRLAMMGDDALNRTKSRAGSLYIPAGVGIDQRRPSINQPITSPEKPTRRYVPNIGKSYDEKRGSWVDVNRYQPSGDLVRCVETESLTSVTHLATIPVGIGGLSGP